MRTTQVNTLMMLVVGLFFTYTMAHRGLTVSLSMALIVTNTPLNAYFSRYLSTRAVVLAAPGSRRVFMAYARDLTLLYMVSNCLVGALIVWLGGGLVEAVAAGAAASLAGATTAVLLEVYRPLTSWKSERDVMRHPRKYLLRPRRCSPSWSSTRSRRDHLAGPARSAVGPRSGCSPSALGCGGCASRPLSVFVVWAQKAPVVLAN